MPAENTERQPVLVTLESGEQKPAQLGALTIDPKWIAIALLAIVVGYLVWKEMKK